MNSIDIIVLSVGLSCLIMSIAIALPLRSFLKSSKK